MPPPQGRQKESGDVIATSPLSLIFVLPAGQLVFSFSWLEQLDFRYLGRSS